jgi:subtilisin family serine protease
MKKTLLLASSLLYLLPLFSQSEQKFDLYLSSGTVTRTIGNNSTQALWPDSGETINSRYYRHIRFATFPDFAKRAAMENAGIKLLYYISSQTYLASVAAATPNALDPSFVIQGVYKIAPKEKMHLELSYAIANTDFPAYTIGANGNVGITFTYYADIPHQLVIDQLAAYEVTYQNPNSHRVTVWVPQNAIESFVAKSFVCAAELKDDLPVPDNNEGRTNHRDNWMAQEFAGGRMYNGAGVNVMLQDDGVIGPHIDYTGRLIQQYVPVNIGNHGDHCAGTIMGGGNKDPLTRGMGWGANLYVYQAVPYQGYDSIYSHYVTNSIVITSTSYSDGCNAGYTTLAQTLDQQIYDMPNLIHVFSAGNNGAQDCSYGAGATWGNVTGGHKHSKNSIAVGNLTYEDIIAASSSRGPVHDGRMKPEVCAVGTNVYSTIDANNYDYKTGTSMSCPAVSGTFSELYQAYKVLNGNVNPPSGLMKAILMNTADDLGNPGPDFIYGYGRINGRKAIIPVEQTMYFIDAITNNSTNTHTITVPANTGRLKVMVYWHDHPAAVNASVALVNDIDMQVTTPSAAVFNPWVLDFTPNASNLNAVATRGNDIRNNHEQVTIDNPAAGNFSVSITGANIPMGPQEYYLVWYFEPADELVMTYPNGGEGFAPNEIQTIRWDALGNTGTFNIEYSTDSGINWATINGSVAASLRHFNWTVPSALSGECMVRITRGAATDRSDVPFSIIPIPANLTVDWACPDSLQLSWSAVAGATEYDVFRLGTMYMDSIGNSTTTSCVVYNLNNITNTYWFSVRAKGAQQATGRRAIAIEKTPGVFCPGAFDASAISLSSPDGTYISCMNTTALPVIIQLNNPGLTTLTNIPVSFSVNGGPPVNETFTGSIAPSGSATYTFTATAAITTPGANSVEAWTAFPNDINMTNDTTTISVFYDIVFPVLPPMAENFETFPLCSSASDCEAVNCALQNGFKNVANGQGDDIDWRTYQGSTPSSSTGPDVDFAPGTATGNYVYLEASGSCSGRTAIMLSPCIDLTTFNNPTLTFAYHMYGGSMGELHLDIYANGGWINDVFTDIGNQGNIWQTTNVSLSAYTGQTILFRFRGVTGSGITSDMAIDGIQIGNLSSTDETVSGASVNLYPNPGDGVFNLSVAKVNNEEVIATIYDVTGRKISSVNYGEVAGSLSSKIDLSAYENGTYILEIQIGSEREIIRMNKVE